jgi:hypothetical protein
MNEFEGLENCGVIEACTSREPSKNHQKTNRVVTGPMASNFKVLQGGILVMAWQELLGHSTG